MKRNALVICFILVCLLLGAQKADEKTALIIGGDYNYPPYEFINSQGQPDGYNVELSRIICRELGYKPIFRLGKWSLVRSWLEDGSIDVIQGMAYSVERASELKFSMGHTRTWRGIFKRNNARFNDLEDNPELLVAVQENDIAEEYLKQVDFQGKISRLSNQEEALKLLNDGVYDAAVVNYMMAQYIIKRDGLKNIKALPQRIQQRDYCFAASDEELISRINLVLQELENRGDLQRLHNKWLGALEGVEKEDAIHKWLRDWYFSLIVIALILVLAFAIYFYIRFRSKEKELRISKTINTQRQYYRQIYGDLFLKGRVMIYRLSYKSRKLYHISESVSELGYSQKELLEMTHDSFIYFEDKPRYNSYYESLSTNAHSVAQYRIITKSGELRWVLDYGKLYNLEHTEELIMLGYLIDITDMKAREVQLYTARERAESEANAKTHFCAVMSHEIRNAINGSFGFIQVLRQMNKDPESEELLAHLYSAEVSTIKMLDNVLDYSKIDSGKLKLILSNFDLKRLVADIVRGYEVQVAAKGITLKHNISELLPQIIFGDQLRLKQIFTNLLQNALKFTESGKIEIAAEPYTSTDDEIRILFKVEDSGIGIQKQRLEDIFENYNQGEDAIGLKYGGSGLGLAIVKRLVEIMQGFIWVESEPDKGTCFYFIIPFCKRAPSEELDTVVQVPLVQKRQQLMGRILLAEHIKVNQIFASKLLQMWGLKVDIAQDGTEAFELHKEKLYDMILVNNELPILGGLGLCKEIRKLERVLQRETPIICALDTEATEEEQMHLRASGMDACISKPVDIDALYEILGEYLQKAE